MTLRPGLLTFLTADERDPSLLVYKGAGKMLDDVWVSQRGTAVVMVIAY